MRSRFGLKTLLPILCFLLALPLCFTPVAEATNIFTFSDTQLLSLGKYAPLSDASSTLLKVTDTASWATLDVAYYGELGIDDVPGYYSIAIGTTVDLTGYDTYALQFFNDNDDPWYISLYVDETLSGSYLLNVKKGITLSMSLGALATPGAQVGFVISQYLPGNPSPSNPDAYHLSVSPVPEPTTLLLIGIGVLGVGYVQRKRLPR